MHADFILSANLDGSPLQITTEKEIQLLPGAPVNRCLKRSTYCVTPVEETPRDLPTWASMTETKAVVVNRRNNKEYLVCQLFKGGPRGKSEFIDMEQGDIYEKADLRKWIPEGDFNTNYVLVGFETIKSATVVHMPKQCHSPIFDLPSTATRGIVKGDLPDSFSPVTAVVPEFEDSFYGC